MKELVALSALRPGEGGIVQQMRGSGPLRRRLRDLGMIEGAEVRCLGRSPGGDPAAYRVCGAVLALRDRDSAQIFLCREGDAP